MPILGEVSTYDYSLFEDESSIARSSRGTGCFTEAWQTEGQPCQVILKIFRITQML